MPRKTKEDLEKEKAKSKASTKTKVISKVVEKPKAKVSSKVAEKPKIKAKTSTKLEEKTTKGKSSTEKKKEEKKPVKKETKATEKTKASTKLVKKPVEKKVVKEEKTSTKKLADKKAPIKKAAKVTKTKAARTSSTVKGVKKLSKASVKPDVIEYYDLPYRYNKTIVKILAQTPNTLFVYWDISDEDRKNYVSQYGDDFFNNTKPVLLVRNISKDYSFEIEINDFANSWYFNVNDEKCEYVVELGRRPVKYISIPNDYLHIANSNTIEAPNDHILFEKNQKIIYFRNVQNGAEYSKNIANLQFLRYMGKIYNIYDLYHKIYNDEEILDLKNPSSNNPTSRF